MKIKCPKCSKEYIIPDERLLNIKTSITIPCPSCKSSIVIEPPNSPDVVPDQNSSRDNMAEEGKPLKDRILKSLKDLPPMPQVAQKARQVIDNPASSFSDLAKVIETDQAIVARILKIANSPYYGLSGKVSSVQHASVVLGVKTLMEILNLACSSEILGRTLTGYNLDAGELWAHSLAVASGSQIIARKVSPSLEQDAFSAGLIHDSGKIILDPYIEERKDVFNAFVSEGKETFLNAEKNVLGFDHAELAAEACEKWHIPAQIAFAIKHHHDPTPSKGDILSYIVHMADAIAMMSGIGSGIDGMLYQMHPEAIRVLKLSPDDMSMIMGQIAEYVEKTTQ